MKTETDSALHSQLSTLSPAFIPPGYKRTEVGVIPEEWRVVPFSDFVSFLNGVNADKGTYGSGLRFVNVLEVITKTHLKGTDIPGRVTLSSERAGHYAVEYGDFLFNRTSETQDEVGLGSVYIGDERIVFGGFVIRGHPRDDRLQTLFAGYALRAPGIRRQIIARGQGAIRANIGQADLRQVLLPVPTKAEQEAIAEALSDADALIESLEGLIAKKRQIKQGAMQELLTGKTRLPGFESKPGYKQTEAGEIPNDWALQDLGSVAAISTGRKDVNEGNPAGKYPFFTCSRYHAFSDQYSFDMEAILIAGNGDVGNLHYYSGRFEAYQRTYVVHQFSLPVRYVWHQLDYRLIKSLGIGTIGTSIPYIKKGNLTEFAFPVPTTEAEQSAIATILYDMDAEIAALETKLAKARQIKGGMMQELLTGRIRLVSGELRMENGE